MINRLSNDGLIAKTHSLFQEERRLDLEILRHLYEIDTRKLYLEKSFPSLFEMCVGEFKLSRASAYRRISAMRALKELPELAPKIESGELSVSVIAQTQSFFKAEKKDDRSYSKEEKLELFQSFENKSTRDVERTLAGLNPEVQHHEKIQPISATQSKLTLIIRNELQAKMDELKNLKSHVNHSMTYEGLLELLVDQELKRERKKIEPKSETARGKKKTNSIKTTATPSKPQDPVPAPDLEVDGNPASSSAPASHKRAPHAELKRKIWHRDHAQCMHRDPLTNKQCQAKAFLQMDHVIPFSEGGPTTDENLRLLCAAHNRGRHFGSQREFRAYKTNCP